MSVVLWTVEDGNVIQINVNGKVQRLHRKIDLSKYSIDEVMGYIKIISDIGEPVVSIKLEQPIRELETKAASRLSDDIGDVQNESIYKPVPRVDVLKQEVSTKVTSRNSAITSLASIEECFPMPKDSKSAYRKIPVAAIDMVYDRFIKGKDSLYDIRSSPEWKWHKEIAYCITNYWTRVGTVKHSGRNQYEKNIFPHEQLRQLCINLGIDITEDDVRRHFWIPKEVALAWLDRLANENFLQKHPRKGYKVIVKDLASLKPVETFTPSKPELKQQVAVGVKWPHPSTFKWVKTESRCTACGHNYGHAYQSGRVTLCGGDYEKIGGVKSHGENATIRKS